MTKISNGNNLLCLFVILLSITHLPKVNCLQSNEDLTPRLNEETTEVPQSGSTVQRSSGRVTVVAPKYLRPQSNYFVLITLTDSQTAAIFDLQLTGARDSNREQIQSHSTQIQPGESQQIKFTIGDWPPAEYILSVNVKAIDQSWNFQQETSVNYHAKSFTGLIQTDKAIYKPSEQVQFRVIFLNERLAPLSLKEEINVTISDPKRNIIHQWTNLSNFRGLLTLELRLSDDPMLGDWTINVEARGQQFSKVFTVAEYILPTFDVEIQLPPYATYNDSEILATVRADYTYGKPVSGHVTLTVQPLVRFVNIDTRPLEQAQYRARLQDGSANFKIPLRRHLQQQGNFDLFERDVEFFALVEEDLTGRKYNRTSTIRVHSKSIKIERLHGETSFKPGLSQLIQYKVTYQDGTPIENVEQNMVLLEYWFLDKKLAEFRLRPIGGIIEHELEVPHKVKRPSARVLGRPDEFANPESEIMPDIIEIKAYYRGHAHYPRQLTSFQTKSGQYMQIDLPQLQQRISKQTRHSAGAQVNIGDNLKVRLRSTEPMNAINCQSLTRGDIIWAFSLDARNKSEMEFDTRIDQRMAPEARILCFYVRPDNNELIADAVNVPVSGFMRNFVKLSPSRTEAKPGQQLVVDALTKPDSLVGLSAIDQSVLLLKSGHDINAQQVLDDNARFSGIKSTARNNINSSIRNADELFDSANLVVMTNNIVENGTSKTNPLLYTVYPVSSIRLDKLVLDHEIQPPAFHLNSNNNNRKIAEQIIIRSVFPETWLWQNGTADSSGKLKFEAKIPDSITSWQLSAFSLSEAHGFGITDNKSPATIRVFRPFFVRLNLPYSIIRGETINIQAIVFNYNKRPTVARVTFDNSRGDFEFIEPANSIEEEQHANKSSESRLVNVPANDGVSVSFLVRPLKIGHLDVKVIAQGELNGDGVLRKLLVKPEGQTQHFNRAMLIRISSRSSRSLDSAPFKQNITIQVPANAVPDSRQVHVAAIGDILGAGLANVDNLLRLPDGCGEQNMINLVPNIVIYNYLQSTNRLRQAQKQRALRNIETGYQRQLNYKRFDGSFSAFGGMDTNGSVWLTAYVLRTLNLARKIITVDDKVLKQAASFVTSFARSDGSIEEVGMLHNRQLSSAASESAIYLTAYVLAVLHETADVAENGATNKEIVDKGLAYLERQLDSSDDAYDLAIIAHTMQLAGRQAMADRAYDKLWARANEHTDQVWWTSNKSEQVTNFAESTSGSNGREREPLVEYENTASNSDGDAAATTATPKSRPFKATLKPLAVTTKQSAHLFTPNSLAVEATSWALLTIVRRGELERGLPVVRWLVGQQNSNGGFASTQDTVLAIEALASFAQASNEHLEQMPTSLEIDFTYPRAKGESQIRRTDTDQINIEHSNALVQQHIRLPDNINWVQVQATGTGIAVVQISWQYNLLVSAEEPAFYLSPILDRTSTINYLQLSICTYYKAGPASNMAVVEIELPSGYVADAESLPGLKRHKSIKRIDTEDGETKVIVYLDQVTRNEEICFTVPAHRSTKVSNNRPVPVTIYDYYDRTKAARIFYEAQPASSCDICESDSCTQQCSNKPKRSRLLSLHEQRRMNKQLAEQKHQTSQSSNQTHANIVQSNDSNRPNNITIPSARELLPLSPALESLKKVVGG